MFLGNGDITLDDTAIFRWRSGLHDASLPPGMADVLAILPTFNERKNIGDLIDRLFEQPLDMHVLVVDDDSPDGTAEIVRERQKHHGEEKIKLIVRTEGKNGRGTACLIGYSFAREHGYKAAIEMDADFSHDPADIPKMVAKLRDSGADIVIGSKRLPESGIVGWPVKRHVLSWCANKYLKALFRMPVSDCTNGFRCYGPRSIQLLPDLKFEGKGMTVIHQEIYQLHLRGMKLTEVPTVFMERRGGRSNMSFREIGESFFGALKARSETLHLHATQTLKFGITGVINTILDIILLSVFVELVRLPVSAAGPFSSIFVLTNVFLMNKYWTFQNPEKKHVEQGVKFAVVYGSSFVLVNLITWVLAEPMQIWYILSRLIAIAICAVWNYSWLHCRVFK